MTKLLVPRPIPEPKAQDPHVRAETLRLRGGRSHEQPVQTPMPPTRTQIEKRAYYIYLERGRAGDPAVDWAVAEQQAWAEYHLELEAFRLAAAANRTGNGRA